MTEPAVDDLVHRLDLGPGAWVSTEATVIGRVSIGQDSSVWYRAVIRADGEDVELGARTNIQDTAVLHTDPGHPIRIGDDVSVGHGAILHGCRIDDCVLVGMGAVVLNGARLRRGVLVAAGAVVLEGTEAPEHAVLAGVPARVIRIDESNATRTLTNAADYVRLSQQHARHERS